MYTLSFAEYGLSPELMNGLADTRIEKPTPLQKLVVPVALQGRHLLVKTEATDEGAFLIPTLQALTTNGEVSGTRVLILTPSKERAKVIDELIWALGYHAQISSVSVSMNGNKKEHESAVLEGAPVIVANPGQLVDILEKTRYRFNDIATLVIDEAHEMENFNLVSRMKSIFKTVDGDPQVMVFSANINKATQELAKSMLKNPEYIGLEEEEIASLNKQLNSVPAPPVDEKTAQKRLDKVSVKVVLNPDNGRKEEAQTSDSEMQEISEKEVAVAPTEVANDTEVVEETKAENDAQDDAVDPKEKLKKASAKTDINSKKEEEIAVVNEDSEADAEVPAADAKELANVESDVNPEEKLKAASVKVVLNSDKEEKTTEVVEEPKVVAELTDTDSKEPAKAVYDVDPEEKLKAASIKVVLKKDIEPQPESVKSTNGKAKEAPEAIDADLAQGYIHVPPRMKISTLMVHLEKSPLDKVVVFAASKRTTDRLFRIILKKNWGVVSVHEGIDQATFDERFEKFESGEMKVLLVGGISAKDINIEGVKQVINYDVPADVDEYRYRAELVGNGKASRIVSLVSKMDKEDMDRIVAEAGYPPVEITLPDEIKEKKQAKKSTSKAPSPRKGKPSAKPTRKAKEEKPERGERRKPAKRGVVTKELPRPSYDGLSGGREGKDSGGVFGWVKKLFS